MALTIKTKIATGIGILFSLLIIICTFSLVAINLLSNKTENLLTANYKSIQYCNEMMHAMDRLSEDTTDFSAFEKALYAQEHNITEPGEKQATIKVRDWFQALKINRANSTIDDSINSQLYNISQLNQKALEAKNKVALETASGSKLWLTLLNALVLIFGLSLAFNLPNIVADPIKRLTEGIREIAKGHYKTRIYLDNQQDEFGEMAFAFNSMAGRLDDWENSSMARLVFEKSRVDNIINQMEDAVLSTDAENRILSINRAAANLYNLNSDNIVSQPVDIVASHNDLLKTVINNNTRSPLKIVVDGKEQFFTIVHKAVQIDGKSLGNVYTLKNITHFKELDLSKTNLLATISHELKTPISSIKMSAKLLNDERIGNLNGEQAEMVGNIVDSAERLLKLTGELLNMTQLETGNIQLRFQNISPKTIVQEAIQATQVQAQQQHIIVLQNIPENLPLIQVDADKTALVLINFLTNAIKYSQQGGVVKMDVSLNDDKIHFCVGDEGEGIENKYQSRIFDRYFKVPDSVNKSGTGLGLAISKEFIEAQKGEIGVESKIGIGSEFWFDLPIGN